MTNIGSPIPNKNSFSKIYNAFRQNEAATAEMLEVLEPVLRSETDEKGSSFDFETIRLTSGMIGPAPKQAAEMREGNNSEPDPQENDTTMAELFNTNALAVLRQFLHCKQAFSDEKELISEALWEILTDFRSPDEEIQMSDERFRELRRQIFMNSPYIKPAVRKADKAYLYLLDRFFGDLCEE